MSVLLHSFPYVCYELFLNSEQQFLFPILWFMLFDLLGKFYYGNCMIDFSFILDLHSFVYCVFSTLFCGFSGFCSLIFLSDFCFFLLLIHLFTICSVRRVEVIIHSIVLWLLHYWINKMTSFFRFIIKVLFSYQHWFN